jgi:hypothetical protein
VHSVAVVGSTGVAKPLAFGCIDFKAVRLRRARLRLSARRREAMSPKGGSRWILSWRQVLDEVQV